MKRYLLLSILSCSLGSLLISPVAIARQTTMATYFPSPSGNYSKILLVNGANGPNENTPGTGSNSCFCAQTFHNPSGALGAQCDTGETGAGYAYVNAGIIFADPSGNGYLEICKSDGSAASYPGTCFNRFANVGSLGLGSCPHNYQEAPGTQKNIQFVTGSSWIVTWSCCFGSSIATITKSGCFSIQENTNSSGHPASCSSVDTNAYDIGCETLTDASGQNTYKRNCCYNAPSGSLSTPSTCATGGGSGSCSSGEVWYNGSCCTPGCTAPGGDGCGGTCIACGSGPQITYYSNNAASGQHCCCENCVGPDQYWIDGPGLLCSAQPCGSNC